MKQKIDIEALKAYLQTLQYADFKDAKQGESEKIIKGVSMKDIEFFKKDITKIPLSAVINYGDIFLADIVGNDLSLVVLTKRKYKMPDGRVCKLKFIQTIINDCQEVFGSPINGFWKVPQQFILKNS